MQNTGRRRYKCNHLAPQCNLSNLKLVAAFASILRTFEKQVQTGRGHCGEKEANGNDKWLELI